MKSHKRQVVMGIDDGGLQEVFDSSASDPSGVPNRREDALSPEDEAWVDSCLVKDFGYTDDNWDDVKEALLGIISSQVPSTFELSIKTSEVNDDFVPVNDEKSEAIPLGDFMQDHLSPDLHYLEKNGDTDVTMAFFLQDHLSHNPINLKENEDDEAEVAVFLRDHLPYNHTNLEENGNDEPKVPAGSVADAESHEDIFRVWDLGTQFEVDELTKQLSTVLEESSLRVPTLTLDDLDAAASNEKIFDDLLTGIADLSLNPKDLTEDF